MGKLQAAAFSVAIVGASVMGAWLIMTIIDAAVAYSNQRSFRADLIKALKKGTPTWDQVCTMADSHHLVMARTVFVLKELVNAALTGRMPELDKKVRVLELLLEEHQKQLPFENLPSETRFIMERLKKLLGGNGSALYPLAANVAGLIKKNAPGDQRQRFYTFGGFILGLVGILFTAFTYRYPLPTAPAKIESHQPAPVSSAAHPGDEFPNSNKSSVFETGH